MTGLLTGGGSVGYGPEAEVHNHTACFERLRADVVCASVQPRGSRVGSRLCLNRVGPVIDSSEARPTKY